MARVNVESSFIEWVEFDNENNTLTIGFRDGSESEYPCDLDEYEAFLRCPSKGKFFNAHFK